MEENQANILADIISESQLTQAGTGKRFANLIIDYIIFVLLFICFCVVWALLDPNTFNHLAADGNSAGGLLLNLFAVVFHTLYYSLIEFLTKGRSIGKLITGTKVVTDEGNNISIGQAFTRSLSRLVPFEPFSALGTPSYPWHDKWTHTYVIDIKKSSML